MNTTNDTPTPDLENRLRTEFADRASRATGADRIRTALASQPLQLSARRRPAPIGRWITVAAAVAVVAAGIPIGLRLASHNPPDPSPPSASSLRADVAYQLSYQAGWLPSEFVVSGRTASVNGAAQRQSWVDPRGSAAPPPTIELDVFAASSLLGQTQIDGIQRAKYRLDINGHRGYVLMDGENAALAWQPDQDTVLMVEIARVASGLPTAERIARSVVRTNPVPVTSGLAFGQLPSGYQPFSQGASGRRSAPERTIGAIDGPLTPGLADVTAMLSPSPDPADIPDAQRKPVTVRGRPAIYQSGRGDTVVQVRLADGYWLSVLSSPRAQTPPMPEDQLVAIANDITIDPDADFSWLDR